MGDSEPQNPFGDAFESLNQLLAVMQQAAQFNRATFIAHMNAGFTPDESMKLTIAVMDSLVKNIMAPQATNIIPQGQ